MAAAAFAREQANVASGHRGTRAIQRMVEYAPSTGGLALWVHHCDMHHDLPAEEAPTHEPNRALTRAPTHATMGAPPDANPVATDGRTIFYSAGFERLPLQLQAGHVAHEVLHIALRHTQRFEALRQTLGDVDRQLFNICADAIVNSALAHLTWLQLPPDAVLLERLLAGVPGSAESVDALLLAWDVEKLYRAIDDRLPATESTRIRGDGPRAAHARARGADTAPDLHPGGEPAEAPEREAEQAREWRERLLRGHAGDGAHSMLRTLLADLPQVRTPWEQVLRTRLAHALALQPDLSWSRPSRSYLANQGRCGPHRRMPFEPGHSPSKAVPKLVVVVDVSGSIDTALMDRFAREVEAIARRLAAGLVLVVGDDRVRRVEHLLPERGPGRVKLGDITFHGGGGTDFTPLLEEAARHRPDITVVLTDLEGPARFCPRTPVLWAVPDTHADAVPPFGRKLVLR